MNIEKCLLTNLKLEDMFLNQKNQLCSITMVSEPRKAGKHGSAKIFYNYTILYSNNKVQSVGKSRDELSKINPIKHSGERVFEDTEEISFINNSTGEIIVQSRNFFISLNSRNKNEVGASFYYFIYNNYCFYTNK